VASLVGGFIMKYAVVMAGHASADDPVATFEFAGGQPRVPTPRSGDGPRRGVGRQ
jgi:hypothetical protein